MKLPRLYPIADVETLARKGLELRTFVREVLAGGAKILQLRDKQGSPEEVLQHAATVAEVLVGSACLPVMNDRADLALLAGWHSGQGGHLDLPPDAVRRVLGKPASGPSLIGVSTHSEEQVRAANTDTADYLAIGPVFATGTKQDAEPVVGLDGVRRVRRLTAKPLVAIGGITRENAASVLEAGAESVAVIGGLFVPGMSVEAAVRDFLVRLR